MIGRLNSEPRYAFAKLATASRHRRITHRARATPGHADRGAARSGEGMELDGKILIKGRDASVLPIKHPPAPRDVPKRYVAMFESYLE